MSETTVSHVLSGKRPVSTRTADRVRDAIATLGYVPHFAARTLPRGRAMVIAVVVPDVADPFFARLAAAVERAADAKGYLVVITSSIGRPERESRYLDLLRSRAVDGLVYVAGRPLGNEPITSRGLHDHPVVLADEWVPGLEELPLVTADNVEGGRLAGEHLRALGHRDVAILTGPPELRTAQERLAGFTAVMPDAVVVAGDFTEAGGFQAARALLEGSRPLTAIFASSDLMAYGVIAAAREAGLTVPRDLSVVGFDDIGPSSRIAPALTTVRQPIEAIGELAATTLIGILGGVPAAMLQMRPVELVVRASSAAPQ